MAAAIKNNWKISRVCLKLKDITSSHLAGIDFVQGYYVGKLSENLL
ncbi:MAG: hypothetical protein RXR65_02120 [Hydrogenobaculum sp.]